VEIIVFAGLLIGCLFMFFLGIINLFFPEIKIRFWEFYKKEVMKIFGA